MNTSITINCVILVYVLYVYFLLVLFLFRSRFICIWYEQNDVSLRRNWFTTWLPLLFVYTVCPEKSNP